MSQTTLQSDQFQRTFDSDRFEQAHPEAEENRLVGRSYVFSHARPPARQSLSEWAEANFTLSSEYASRSGHLRLFGWQRQIFDAFTDPAINDVTLKCGAQLVKTLFLQCAMAYVAVRDPGPVLLVQPTNDDAKAFSKERLNPMIRDNSCLRGIISDSVHDGTNTLTNKIFPGGSLSIVGAVAPGNFRRRSIRYAFYDEVDADGYNPGPDGDVIGLGDARLTTFGSRRKAIRCSTPTRADTSRIAKYYAASDQRKPYVRCPVCEFEQILKWPQVKWDNTLPRDERPASAYYECDNPACRAHWTDTQRKTAADKAVFKTDRPCAGKAGFWISSLYHWAKTLEQMVDEFLSKKDDRTQLQTFVNNVLAEEWEDEGETPDYQMLFERREGYEFGESAIVPQRAVFLTAAVDVQDSPPRLEVEVKAWGRNRENWSIDYQVLQVRAENGQLLPVTSPELWDLLDKQVLQRAYEHESGHHIPIWIMCIDTGNRPKPVYDFARRHAQLTFNLATGPVPPSTYRIVVPIKGTDEINQILCGVSKEDAVRARQGVRIWRIGTYAVKQELFDALQYTRPKADSAEPNPGYCHFPAYDLTFFKGLCSERRQTKANGDLVYKKIEDGRRNEPLDLSVYNRAAAAMVGFERWKEETWAKAEWRLRPVDGTLVSSSLSPSAAGGAATNQSPVSPANSNHRSQIRPVRSIRGSFL